MSKKRIRKIYILLAMFFFLLIAINSASAVTQQPTQQFNKLFLSPFYVQSTTSGIGTNFSINVNPPDDIKYVLSAIINFDIWLNPSVNFTLLINGKSCNNPAYYVSTTYASAGKNIISFDCSNVINKEGTYNVVLKATRDTGAVTGWLDLTYMNNPLGELNMLGTEYSPNDKATFFLQLKDNQGLPINDGHCEIDVYTPLNINSTHTQLIVDAPMLQLGDDGIYYYDMVAPSILGVYMLGAECSYSMTSVWVYSLCAQELNKPARNVTTGTYAGDTIFLNDFKDGIYTDCASGAGTKICDAFYDFNMSVNLQNITNITNINLYYMGESSAKSILSFYVWNWTNSSWIALPNNLTFSGGASTTAPIGVGDFASNSLPLDNIISNGIIRVRTYSSWTSIFHQFDNWLNINIKTTEGTIQDMKGSSEMHITNIPQATANLIQNSSLNVNMSSINTTLIAETIWNYTNRNLTYYEDVTNYTNVASSVWNWAGSVSNSILTSIWGYVNRTLTYYEDTTNYSKVAEYVWVYENRNLTFYEVNNISAGEIWSYMNRSLTLYPDMTNYSQIADYVWNYVDRNLTFEYINNISAEEIWSYYNRSLTDDIPFQVWSYPNRNLTTDIPFEVWTYTNRTLTYYTLNLTELIDMINAFEFEEIAIPFPSITEQNELTSFTLNVRLIIQT